MRFVVYGAGAVGGVVGARLFEHGHDVVLIARGAHHDAIRERGLTVESPDGSSTLDLPVVDHPGRAAIADGDAVLLAMKSHDTADAVRALAEVAPVPVAVACLQNGVDNERTALRLFGNVYGVCVMCPTAHLGPGVVQAFSSPTTGILDVGRYPAGVDDVAESIAAAFRGSTFSAEARPDVVRAKYGKLVSNLGNAVEAVCGPPARLGPIGELVEQEGVACLRAAGIDFVSREEDAARRGDLLQVRPIDGLPRPGGSSWQSLHRRVGSIETDYLNGEIVLLGRRHGVATPANELLQRLANTMARSATPPGTVPPDEFLARLAASTR